MSSEELCVINFGDAVKIEKFFGIKVKVSDPKKSRIDAWEVKTILIKLCQETPQHELVKKELASLEFEALFSTSQPCNILGSKLREGAIFSCGGHDVRVDSVVRTGRGIPMSPPPGRSLVLAGLPIKWTQLEYASTVDKMFGMEVPVSHPFLQVLSSQFGEVAAAEAAGTVSSNGSKLTTSLYLRFSDESSCASMLRYFGEHGCLLSNSVVSSARFPLQAAVDSMGYLAEPNVVLRRQQREQLESGISRYSALCGRALKLSVEASDSATKFAQSLESHQQHPHSADLIAGDAYAVIDQLYSHCEVLKSYAEAGAGFLTSAPKTASALLEMLRQQSAQIASVADEAKELLTKAAANDTGLETRAKELERQELVRLDRLKCAESRRVAEGLLQAVRRELASLSLSDRRGSGGNESSGANPSPSPSAGGGGCLSCVEAASVRLEFLCSSLDKVLAVAGESAKLAVVIEKSADKLEQYWSLVQPALQAYLQVLVFQSYLRKASSNCSAMNNRTLVVDPATLQPFAVTDLQQTLTRRQLLLQAAENMISSGENRISLFMNQLSQYLESTLTSDSDYSLLGDAFCVSDSLSSAGLGDSNLLHLAKCIEMLFDACNKLVSIHKNYVTVASFSADEIRREFEEGSKKADPAVPETYSSDHLEAMLTNIVEGTCKDCIRELRSFNASLEDQAKLLDGRQSEESDALEHDKSQYAIASSLLDLVSKHGAISRELVAHAHVKKQDLFDMERTRRFRIEKEVKKRVTDEQRALLMARAEERNTAKESMIVESVSLMSSPAQLTASTIDVVAISSAATTSATPALNISPSSVAVTTVADVASSLDSCRGRGSRRDVRTETAGDGKEEPVKLDVFGYPERFEMDASNADWCLRDGVKYSIVRRPGDRVESRVSRVRKAKAALRRAGVRSGAQLVKSLAASMCVSESVADDSSRVEADDEEDSRDEEKLSRGVEGLQPRAESVGDSETAGTGVDEVEDVEENESNTESRRKRQRAEEDEKRQLAIRALLLSKRRKAELVDQTSSPNA